MRTPDWQSEDGSVTLYRGDSAVVLPYVGTVRAAVTSPPYDSLRKYGGNWGCFDFEAVATGITAAMEDGAALVWVVADATICGSETGTSFRQALYFKDCCGLSLHDTMIYKVPGTGAKGSNRAYWQSFEYMFVFAKGRMRTVHRLRDKVNVKAGTVSTSNKQGRDGVRTRLHPRGGTVIAPVGYRENVWVIPSGNGHSDYTGHPAPFPVALARDHILSWTNEGDVVLDPFMGSGTTGVACVKTGRKFIGVELDPGYFEIAKGRIQAAITERQGQLIPATV
jgi:hypothetical protein